MVKAVTTPSRSQIAAVVGNDMQLARLLEDLFVQAGNVSPGELTIVQSGLATTQGQVVTAQGNITALQAAVIAGANAVKANPTASPAVATEVALGLSQLMGRGSAGNLAAISLGAGLSMTGTTLIAAVGGSGDVVGPAAATNTAVARFNTTTGKLLQDSLVTISNQGRITMPSDPAIATPAAGTISFFGRTIAGRAYPAYIGPSGLDSALQPLMARNKVGYWCPQGNSTVVPGVLGFGAPTVTGFTATARNVATTRQFTRFRRLGYVTEPTVGAVGQWRISVAQFTVGNGSGEGGFTYIIRFGISDLVTVADARMFMGMNAVVTPTNVEPSTLTTCVGVGHGAADTNLKIFYGGSSAQTPIDLGANFPITANSFEMYELALFCAPTEQTIKYEVTRLSNGTVATGTMSGAVGVAVPNSTTLLGPWGYRTNNATALAVGLDVASAYIETDI